MSERERIQDDNGRHAGAVYDAPVEATTVQQPVLPAVTPQYGTNTLIVVPTDRVRWGPVIAGLFAALSALVVLSVLGLGIGLSGYDVGDPAQPFGIGAGVWGAISAFIAFGIGGWLAARTAAVPGRGNGFLNGAMVWMVAVPLLVYLLGGGLGTLQSIVDGAAITAAQVAAPIVDQAAIAVTGNPAFPAVAQPLQPTPATPAPLNQLTPADRQAAIAAAGTIAWGTLVSLLLGFIAASLGGLLGARSARDQRVMLG
jgi:hypothetical protein